MIKILLKAAYSLLLVMAFVSCKTSKGSLVYFEDIQQPGESVAEIPLSDYAVKIQPGDELIITVTSVNPEATAPYNLPLSNPATNAMLKATATPQQQTYLVTSGGDISFPVLGQLHVEGLSTVQLTEKLTEMISKEVVDPVVMVRLVNFKINVMGEVQKPGPVVVEGERMSILDAIAAAGDLTVYGNRETVLLIREENGVRKYYHINLNDSKTLESPLFYLQQNDVVLVSPNEIQQSNSRYNQFNSYKLSVTSTIVSAASVIASLVIALTIK